MYRWIIPSACHVKSLLHWFQSPACWYPPLHKTLKRSSSLLILTLNLGVRSSKKKKQQKTGKKLNFIYLDRSFRGLCCQPLSRGRRRPFRSHCSWGLKLCCSSAFCMSLLLCLMGLETGNLSWGQTERILRPWLPCMSTPSPHIMEDSTTQTMLVSSFSSQETKSSYKWIPMSSPNFHVIVYAQIGFISFQLRKDSYRCKNTTSYKLQ